MTESPCWQGFCRTCVVPVLAGEVEHRDRCLTGDERAENLAVCVARGDGRITLEL